MPLQRVHDQRPSRAHPVASVLLRRLSNRVASLQRSLGNQAVQRLFSGRTATTLQRHPNSEFNEDEEEKKLVSSVLQRTVDHAPRAVLQRTTWQYDGKAWRDPKATAGVPKNLPTGRAFLQGDRFDDETGKVYSSANVRVLGRPTTFGNESISKDEENKVRTAVAGSKVWLQNALNRTVAALGRVTTAEEEVVEEGEELDAGVKRSLELAFNIRENESYASLKKTLTIVSEALRLLITGLETADLPIVRAAEKVTKLLFFSMEMTGAAGYVERGLTEDPMFELPTESTERFKPLSADIHINWKVLADEKMGMNTIIHEACHKFLNSWDYTYGVDTSKGTDQWLDDQAELMHIGRADLVDRFVWEALADSVSSVVKQGLDMGPPVPEKHRAISRIVFNLKNSLLLAAADKREDVFKDALTNIRDDKGMTSSDVRSMLEELLDPARRGTFIAKNGRSLGVRGPALLFVIPTNYLLNNADSYMDYVAALNR